MSMFRFGTNSAAKLETVHPDLVALAYQVMGYQIMDFTIIWGFRGETSQNTVFESGASTKPWPESKHNILGPDGNPLSEALDYGPWRDNAIPWKDRLAFAVLAGAFLVAAKELDVKLRWGGDWDMDGNTTDQTLMDLGHIELA